MNANKENKLVPTCIYIKMATLSQLNNLREEGYNKSQLIRKFISEGLERMGNGARSN